MQIRNRWSGAILVLSLAMGGFGCSSQPAPSPTVAAVSVESSGTPSNLTAQFKAIDDNPHMPPDVKAAYKANLIQAQQVNHNPVVKTAHSP